MNLYPVIEGVAVAGIVGLAVLGMLRRVLPRRLLGGDGASAGGCSNCSSCGACGTPAETPSEAKVVSWPAKQY